MINPEVDKLVMVLKDRERKIDTHIEIDPLEELAYPPGTIQTLEELKEQVVWLEDFLQDYHTYDLG